MKPKDAAKQPWRPVPLDRVAIRDSFWAPRQRVNRARTIPAIYRQLQKGGIDDWKLPPRRPAPGRAQKPVRTNNIATVAKWIESAAYALTLRADPQWEKKLEAIIARALRKDGYLELYRDAERGNLYHAGHLIEAAIAYDQAAGKSRLLERMCAYADALGQAAASKRPGGLLSRRLNHPGLELALVKLGRYTGRRAYLQLAARLIRARGRSAASLKKALVKEGLAPLDAELKLRHTQEHMPCDQQAAADGHAVCLLYLACGMADVALETNNRPLRDACGRLWHNIVTRRMYVTGGVGSSHDEEFSYDYDLANENPTVYAETCGAIGLFLFAYRMLQHETNGQYADIMERALYNGVLAGVSLDGTLFNYINPLAVYPPDDRARAKKWGLRQPWFRTPCCPPNVARLVASLGGYIYRRASDCIFVDLYIGGRADIPLAGGRVILRQATAYPWEGAVRIAVEPHAPMSFAVALRMPAWCRSPKITLNGRPQPISGIMRRGYAVIRRRWLPGDAIELELPMPVERVEAHPSVRQDCGRTALQRGPLVYCLEEIDNGPDLNDLVLPRAALLTARFEKNLLGGVVALSGKGYRRERKPWRDTLYRTAPSRQHVVPVKAVPYFAWHNRKRGEVLVWVRHG